MYKILATNDKSLQDERGSSFILDYLLPRIIIIITRLKAASRLLLPSVLPTHAQEGGDTFRNHTHKYNIDMMNQ